MKTHGSWLCKVNWTQAGGKLEKVPNKAVLLLDEYATSLNEYAPDCLLVGCLQNNNLIRFEGLARADEVISDN